MEDEPPATMPRQADDRADRKVDAAGDDHEGHADGEEGVERHVLRHDHDVRGPRKFGAASEKKTRTTMSAMNVRMSAASSRRAGGQSGRLLVSKLLMTVRLHGFAGVPWPTPRPRRWLVRRLIAVELAGQAAVGHHQDAVRERHHLIEVRGHEHDPEPFRREPPHGAEHLGLGADVDAAARLVHQQHFGRVISALPITTFCWLPPDSERPRLSGLATLIESSRRNSRLPRSFCAADMKRRAKAPEAGQCHVARDRQDLDQSVALAVLRDQRDAARDTRATSALTTALPSTRSPAACVCRPMMHSKNSLRPAPISP